MKNSIFCLLYFVTTLCFCVCVKLPPTFKKCNRNENNFKDCIVQAVEDAITQLDKPFKKYGLPSFEPLQIESIYVGTENGPLITFSQNLTNMNIFGLSSIGLRKFDVDFEKNVVTMEGFFPKISIETQYVFDGNFLGVPLDINGLAVAHIEQVTLKLKFDLKEYAKNSKSYYKIISQTCSINMENLRVKAEIFDEDEVFEDRINRLFNDNWDVLLDQIKGPYEDIFARIFAQIFDNLLAKVPASELF